jgi:putative ABC transport system permease protein
MTSLVQDVGYALRSLRRSPSFAAVAILTLALGIGANSAIFSVLDVVLLRPLPYPDPDRLVMLWTDSPVEGIHEQRSAYGNYADWKRHSRSFEELAAFDPSSATLTGEGPAEQVSVARVSAGFFPVLGVPPRLGRTFTAAEDADREPLVVLSHGLWQSRFGASPDALGASLEIDGRRALVIGVMPAGFAFPDRGTDLWEPHTLTEDFEEQRASRVGYSWFVVGRLRADVPLAQARAEMDGLAAALAQDHPRQNAGLGVSLVPLHRQLTGERMRAGLWVLVGAVVFVLLIACTNVANLLLARASLRERELAIRTSLGASRWRLLRQLLSEAAVLSVLAGVAGLLVALFLIEGVVAWGPGDVPRLAEVRLDGRVLFFTFALSLVVAALFGTGPAWRLTHGDPAPALREGGRGVISRPAERRTSAALVVLEFALAVVLASGAGLLVRSLLRVQSVDPGFRSADVLMMQLAVPQERSPQQRVLFCREAVARVEALPGVLAAGAVNDFFVPERPGRAIFVEGEPGAGVRRHVARVTSEGVSGRYFESMGLPLLAGRLFDEFDRAEARPVATINATMAARFWPGQDAVGRRFFLAGSAAATQPPDADWIEVVGVVGDARRQSLEQRPAPQVYRPHAQEPSRLMTLLVRADGDPTRLIAAIRARIGELDPAVPLYGATTVAERLRAQTTGRRFQTALLGLFALLALALAATGIYGVMHHLVSRRTHEIGVRMAVGASRAAVLRMVLSQGLGLALLGVVIGVAGSLWLGGVLEALLFEVAATDAATLIASALALVGVAMAACYLPARRATRIDPILALRDE